MKVTSFYLNNGPCERRDGGSVAALEKKTINNKAGGLNMNGQFTGGDMYHLNRGASSLWNCSFDGLTLPQVGPLVLLLLPWMVMQRMRVSSGSE